VVITKDELRARITAALAQVRAMPLEELWSQVSRNGGDCEMDSKEAEVVISILEHDFNHELAKVEDLEPEQMNTLSALTDLIMARLNSVPEHHP
jgi:hypothetical protein